MKNIIVWGYLIFFHCPSPTEANRKPISPRCSRGSGMPMVLACLETWPSPMRSSHRPGDKVMATWMESRTSFPYRQSRSNTSPILHVFVELHQLVELSYICKYIYIYIIYIICIYIYIYVYIIIYCTILKQNHEILIRMKTSPGPMATTPQRVAVAPRCTWRRDEFLPREGHQHPTHAPGKSGNPKGCPQGDMGFSMAMGVPPCKIQFKLDDNWGSVAMETSIWGCPKPTRFQS